MGPKFRFIFVALLFIFICLSVSVENNSKVVKHDAVPQRIILNLTEHPSQEMAITWRIRTVVEKSQVEYMVATPKTNYVHNKIDGDDPYKNVLSQKAIPETVHIDEKTMVMHYSAILKNLKPDTLYQYRVGDGEVWSEWAQFRTSSAEEKPFKFIFLGDPQNEIKTFCPRAFRSAYTAAADASFILVAGDLVSQPWRDDSWEELFYSAGWIPRHIPFVLVAGNHGYYSKVRVPGRRKNLHRLWRPHFTQPENGPEGLPETTFCIDFQGVRLIVLNGNEKLKEQAIWLEDLLGQNENNWTVLVIHHPFYSTGRKEDNHLLRNHFLPIIDKFAVDLVLQGHDHNYSRTYKLRHGKIVTAKENGTVYVVSVSGPKFYMTTTQNKHLMKKMVTGLQMYQVLSVDKKVLKFEARTVTNELFDSFELRKKY